MNDRYILLASTLLTLAVAGIVTATAINAPAGAYAAASEKATTLCNGGCGWDANGMVYAVGAALTIRVLIWRYDTGGIR